MGNKSEPKYLKVHRFPDSALFPVNRQFQFVLQEQKDVISCFAGCLMTLAVNAEIIRVADIPEPLFFQFLIQLIQHDVGQYWT